MGDSKLQAITAAVGPSGVQYWVEEVLSHEVIAVLSKLAPPPRRISVPNWTAGSAAASWSYYNFVISLSKGKLSGFDPQFRSVTQLPGGKFELTLHSPPFTASYQWDETYEEQFCAPDRYWNMQCQPERPARGSWPYALLLTGMTVSVTLQLAYHDSAWSLEVVESRADPETPLPSVPPRSPVNTQVQSCFSQTFSKATGDAVASVNFQAPVDALLKNALFTIPDSGHLSEEIVFGFAAGPSGLSFPGDQGVVVGATGQVTYCDEPYLGDGPPPELPVPEPPRDHHLALRVADYEFDALFWAFYAQGSLKTTVTPGDLPDPAPLHTDTYRNTPLQALAERYPGALMNAQIEASVEPTAAFQRIYDLTPEALATLGSKLPKALFDKLAGLAGEVYLEEEAFSSALDNVLGAKDAQAYGEAIEGAAATTGCAVQHGTTVVLEVLQDGTPIPVITFHVTQTDVLRELALGRTPSGSTQTLQFSFEIVPATVTTQLVSSTIGIQDQDFGYIWSFVLAPQFAKELQILGRNGIPLPRIQGFDFVFEHAQVTVEQGYVSILTDLTYSAARSPDPLSRRPAMTASDLQAITVALSQEGVGYFAQSLVAGRLAEALAGLKPPDKDIPFADKLKIAHDTYANCVVKLRNGKLSGLSPAYESLTQKEDGVFELVLKAGAFTVSYDWFEHYDYTQCVYAGRFSGWVCGDPKPVTKQYGYSVSMAGMTITIDLKLSHGGSKWSFAATGSSATTKAPHPSIPAKSLVNQVDHYGCFQTRVAEGTANALKAVDFTTPVQAIFEKVILSVPDSGHLTPEIVFSFATGPSGLAFPGNDGVAIGARGEVSFEGTPYAGKNPPRLGVPAVPKDHHAAFRVADYAFDALFWAFFKDGLLRRLVHPGDLPDPGPLQTDSYRNTPLQALYEAYPDCSMTAGLAAHDAPTVAFQTLFLVDEASLNALQGKLPAEVLGKLQGMKGQVFLTEETFQRALTNRLGQKWATQYRDVIEGAARRHGAVVHHSAQVVLSVISDGSSIPVLTFDVEQTDVLGAFVLGVAESGTTQTLKFSFKIVPSTVNTELVSSEIDGIDTDDFGYLWRFVLEPQYAAEVAKMGQDGIALPRTRGFDFLFDSAQVSLEEGYVSVLTDLRYVPGVIRWGDGQG